MQIFSLFTLSGTPPECLDCKEEVNCSGSKGVQASSGGGAEGAGAGGGDGGGSGGGVGGGGGGSEVCAYECKARGGCTVRYTGPPRGGPSIGDFICCITIIKKSVTRIITIKVPASPLPLEVLAVELHRSVEIATKSGPHKSASLTNFQSRKFQIVGQGTFLEPHCHHHHHHGHPYHRCHHQFTMVMGFTSGLAKKNRQ